MQQRPAPSGGGVFKQEWIRRYMKLPEIVSKYQSWDTAYKKEQHNDPSCCTTWGVDKYNNHYLIDVLTARLDYPELRHVFMEQYNKFKPDGVLVEDKASGQSLIQEITRTQSLPIIGVSPIADKETRARNIAAIFEQGKVFLPEQANWLADYMNELLLFPQAIHDDRVDSTSQYLKWFANRDISSAVWAEPVNAK